MSANNYLRKENPVILQGTPIDPSQALKYAWWFESFRKKLQSGVYRFSYFKTDGSIREARGTLDLARLPEDKL
ncbi:MAG: SH3 beta-barrel fold-containing protein, partial [Paludibacteraceae bacterium]|nr:SH3 beta-barrel fold-containing protein [Paludibacteraceae bacterium]